MGILEWFRYEPEVYKSFKAIDNICIDLYQQFFPETEEYKLAKYKIFYPLLQIGVVEFYGHGKYGLSPSCALFNDDNVLFCNIPTSLFPDLPEKCLYDNKLGIQIFKKSPIIHTLLRQNYFPISKFDITSCLRSFASIHKIINAWNNYSVIDDNHFYCLANNQKWSNRKFPLVGIFKTSDKIYAQRIYRTSEVEWKSIPSKENNIEGYSIAMLAHQIQNSESIKIVYDEAEKRIILKNAHFPILIERLLYFNTLLQGKIEFELANRNYFVKQRDFKLLNKFFDNKIEVK